MMAAMNWSAEKNSKFFLLLTFRTRDSRIGGIFFTPSHPAQPALGCSVLLHSMLLFVE